MEVTGLVKLKDFTHAVSPKESFGHNSGCFAVCLATSRKFVGST